MQRVQRPGAQRSRRARLAALLLAGVTGLGSVAVFGLARAQAPTPARPATTPAPRPVTATTLTGDPVAAAIATTLDANRDSAQSQTRIDGLADAAQTALQRYRTATWQAQQLAVYAQQLQALLAAQEAERASLTQQLVEVERSEREFVPLMLRMQDSLAKFVALDLPFLRVERRERVESLKRLMADPEATTAEKFRRVLEAYQVEIDYGRSLGHERALVSVGGAEAREVEVLRVGRAALFYLTLDGRQAGRWDAAAKGWALLDDDYRASVKKGLRVAREIAAPDVLVLPMPVVAGAAK